MRRIADYLQRKTPLRDIAIVSGLPRSGTSMMMQMLVSGGLQPVTDELRQPDTNNPRGYFEFERVKDLPKADFVWMNDAQGKVVKVITALLPYLPNTYAYRVIFMRRKLQEIIESQTRMLEQLGEQPSGVSDDELMRLYEKHLSEVIRWMDNQQNVNTLYVDYESVVFRPQAWTPQINHFLGSILNESAMISAVDSRLYRQRS